MKPPLIDDRITMLLPDRKNSAWEIRDPAETFRKFAVRPNQIVDYLSLLGDASDNIPGVPGIGPKTAAALLAQHGSIDAMLAEPAKIAGERYRQLLTAHVELLERNRQLIRLRTDLPERYRQPESVCRRQPPDWPKIIALCERWELHSLRRSLVAAAGIPPEPAAKIPADNDGELPLFASPGGQPPAPAGQAEPQMVQDDFFSNF